VNEVRAASALILRGDGRILIGRRSESKAVLPGVWETIGGKIEAEETPEECIRREIWEELETGVDSLEFFRHYDHKLSPELLIHTDVFVVRLVDDPIPNSDDFSLLRWINRQEMERFDLIPEIRQRLVDYFESLTSI